MPHDEADFNPEHALGKHIEAWHEIADDLDMQSAIEWRAYCDYYGYAGKDGYSTHHYAHGEKRGL